MPRALREKNKDFPWLDLAQFRNLISHSYCEASIDRVWKVAKERIPKIKELLKRITLV